MKNLFKTVMKYKGIALFVLLLMAGQAFCEMNLPQYTQALIDTGIQNKGIEHILPEAITESEYDALAEGMSDGEKSYLENAYEDTEGGIHRLKKDISEDELDELDDILLEPVAERYANQIGETLPTVIDKDDRNIKAMGIAYAADCDEKAGLDIMAIQNRFMLRCGGMMLLMSLAVVILTTGISFLAAKVGADIGRDLRKRLFANVMSFSNAEMNEFKTSSLITRATNDIQQVQMTSTMMLRMMLYAACTYEFHSRDRRNSNSSSRRIALCHFHAEVQSNAVFGGCSQRRIERNPHRTSGYKSFRAGKTRGTEI